MSSIRNITSSTPMPPDLAKKIGVSGVNEIMGVFWKGYRELKSDASFVVNASTEEDDITQKWYEKVVGIWDSRNRATSIALNGLCPIYQYADNTMKNEKDPNHLQLTFALKIGQQTIAILALKLKICMRVVLKKSNGMYLLVLIIIRRVDMVHNPLSRR